MSKKSQPDSSIYLKEKTESLLLQLYDNLNVLKERGSKWGSDIPLSLHNQIKDYEQAIVLTQQLRNGEITEPEWQNKIRPLLIDIKKRFDEDSDILPELVYTIEQLSQAIKAINSEEATLPNIPFWRWMLMIGAVVAVLGIIPVFNDSFALIDRFSHIALPTPTPLPVKIAEPSDIFILIATFHSTTQINTEPHNKIRRSIQEAAINAELDVQVEVEPTVLTADDYEKAETLGNQYNADIVIWGEDTGVEVIVNILNLGQAEEKTTVVTIRETERVVIINPSAYASFITTDLPAQLTFISLFAVGQSYYLAQHYLLAIESIDTAIKALPNDVVVDGLDEAYFRLGWLQEIYLSDYKQAVLSFSKAIELNPEYADAYTNRGALYAYLDEYDRSISDLNKALALGSECACTYHNRGAIYSNFLFSATPG